MLRSNNLASLLEKRSRKKKGLVVHREQVKQYRLSHDVAT